MIVETLVLGPLDTNTYLVSAAEGMEVILIDPAAEKEETQVLNRSAALSAVPLASALAST